MFVQRMPCHTHDFRNPTCIKPCVVEVQNHLLPWHHGPLLAFAWVKPYALAPVKWVVEFHARIPLTYLFPSATSTSFTVPSATNFLITSTAVPRAQAKRWATMLAVIGVFRVLRCANNLSLTFTVTPFQTFDSFVLF